MKKPIYKRVWFWVIIAILVIGYAVGSGDEETAKDDDAKVETSTTKDDSAKEKQEKVNEADENGDQEKLDKKTKEEAKAIEEEAKKEDSVPTEYKSALGQAEQYAEVMSMSKKAIYDQLVSEYGGQFPAEAAQYAIDNLEWDYKANALKQAEQYVEQMSMSTAAVYDQLISEYGGQFTAEEAQYAVDNLK